MTGDFLWLDLCRSQLDLVWAQRCEEDGVVRVPARDGDQGWGFDYREPDPLTPTSTTSARARLDEVFPDLSGFAQLPPDWGAAKAGICPPNAWFAFVEGRNPDFPGQAIETTCSSIFRSLDRMDA